MYLLQNVYTSKESASYVVSNKLFQTMEAAVKERDKAIEDAIVNKFSSYEKRLQYDSVNTELPDKPDFKKVEELVMTINAMTLGLT